MPVPIYSNMSSRHLQDMSSRRLRDMSSRSLQDMSSTSLQDIFRVTIFRLPRRLEDVLKASWKTKNCYAEDVFKACLDEQMFAGLIFPNFLRF